MFPGDKLQFPRPGVDEAWELRLQSHVFAILDQQSGGNKDSYNLLLTTYTRKTPSYRRIDSHNRTEKKL